MQFVEETAFVSHIVGDFVFLETQNNGSCGNCSSKVGCGSVSSIFTFKPRNKLKVNNTLGLKQGDSVIIAMAADKLLMATVLMYVTPLVLLFTFSLIAKLLMGETASIVAGLCGLFIGLLWVKRYTEQSVVAEQFQPKLIHKIINIKTY